MPHAWIRRSASDCISRGSAIDRRFAADRVERGPVDRRRVAQVVACAGTGSSTMPLPAHRARGTVDTGIVAV